MKFKKLVTLATVAAVSTSLLVGCSNSKTSENNNGSNKDITIAMVTDVAGVNDQSFNQSAWEGLQRAEKELGVKVKYLESQQDSDYATNIDTLADEEVDLIVGVGMKLAGAIEEGAKLYPDQKFAIVDETYEQIPQNVKTILFQAEQSAYLAGLVSGRMTKTNNIGFIGGMELPVIDTFKYGYMAGAKTANENIEVQAQYANSFTDQAKGKAIANQMFSKAADIVFTAGGDVGTGAIEAARENGKYAVGVDRDQSDVAPETVITSAMKRVDVGMFEVVKELVEGKFEGGTSITYGLDQDAVGLPETTKNLVPQEILDYVNEQIEKLKSGEIKVPKNKEEYDAMFK